MSNLQTQAKIQNKLEFLRARLHHVTEVVKSTNSATSEKTFHDQVTVQIADIRVICDALEWEMHQTECCE